MSRRTIYHPLNQPISGPRFSEGIKNIFPRKYLHEGNAPGPFRIDRMPLVGGKSWLEIVGVTIVSIEFGVTPPGVPEDHPEGPFSAAALKFYVVNVLGKAVELDKPKDREQREPNAYISNRGGVYGYRFGESRLHPPKPLGYFVHPESLLKEEAAIVELGSELYQAHLEAESGSPYQISPLSIFRSGFDLERHIDKSRGVIKVTKVVPN